MPLHELSAGNNFILRIWLELILCHILPMPGAVFHSREAVAICGNTTARILPDVWRGLIVQWVHPGIIA